MLVQIWQTEHHLEVSDKLLRRRPLVHTGFYRAWVSTGLNRQVLGCLQVRFACLGMSLSTVLLVGVFVTQAHACTLVAMPQLGYAG